MSLSSIGDLGRLMSLSQGRANLETRLVQLSGELASGTKSNLVISNTGDFGEIGAIQNRLQVISGYETSARTLALQNEVRQTALETVGRTISSILEDRAASGIGVNVDDTAAANRASGALSAAVSALNASIGGVHVFSGAATDRPAVSSSEVLLSALELEVAGLTSASDVVNAIDNWFVDGGDFETVGYLGSVTASSPVVIDQGQSAPQSYSALDGAIREALSVLALGALEASNSLTLTDAERGTLNGLILERTQASSGALASYRGEIGRTEEYIESTITELKSEETSLQIAFSELTQVDLYETAARLSETENQLNAIYLMTSRLSSLRLASYL